MKKIASYVVVLAIGGVIGTYFDAKHVIEEKVVYKDRIKTQIREVIKEAPDGTKVTERFIEKDEKKDKKVAKKETKPVKKNWGVGVKADLLPNPIGGQTVYTLEVHRRIFSDLYVSGYGRTDGTAGVGVTLFF
jgi:hypothetical protein